ncbi:TerC/Alx family metal homeostasis membrane protein [Pedobacter sp. HMF7647]|uniref:TerC/Alx family metal homeostasis membrane protein n=1 Tax=Hufsiella arboris TaxID=2695275 RepID=A0A7K1YBV6_9SPHI|nr:TerC family protein [Hufsiella arboris]MXV51851.1 TerC/Alx family metal homeostasis membrane protein [Hufsiella arboris]
MSNELLSFGGFIIFIVIALAIDLGLFKKDHVISFKEAAIMSSIWVSFAIAFYFLLIYAGEHLHGISTYGDLADIVKKHSHNVKLIPGNFESSLNSYRHTLGVEFITGYIVEYALSVDNIFVMVLIFSAFGVEEKYYHRVLFWGIIGALVMRFAFIFLGAVLIARFNWITYVFGIFLVYTGITMFFAKDDDEKIDPENHKVVKLASKYLRVHPSFEGNHFFYKSAGRWLVTPLFIVLLVVEFTDLIFAVDSIPAIFSVTKDPYIVFFSNIFAILGLRSMFFLLINVIRKFHYLKTGLAVLLTFIGLKMLGHHWLTEWGFKTIHSLIIIVGILALSILASLIFPKKEVAG